MDLLIDTNIILDVLQNRESFVESSEKVLKMIQDRKIKGVLAAHTIPNLWYIMRKNYSQEQRRFFIESLLDYFEVSSLDKQKLLGALHRPEFSDFEDCLQDECAAELNADYIITRNTRDYRSSRVQALTPEEFLRLKAGDRKYS
ncbi:MAG: PIN domain-containing protein [Treponema sp.]|nr:PIN domain-containing protein [Treponema sp.]